MQLPVMNQISYFLKVVSTGVTKEMMQLEICLEEHY